jgi:hypothetical protein
MSELNDVQLPLVFIPDYDNHPVTADSLGTIPRDTTIDLIVAHQTTPDRREFVAVGRELNRRSATDRLAEVYTDAMASGGRVGRGRYAASLAEYVGDVDTPSTWRVIPLD